MIGLKRTDLTLLIFRQTIRYTIGEITFLNINLTLKAWNIQAFFVSLYRKMIKELNNIGYEKY